MGIKCNSFPKFFSYFSDIPEVKYISSIVHGMSIERLFVRLFRTVVFFSTITVTHARSLEDTKKIIYVSNILLHAYYLRVRKIYWKERLDQIWSGSPQDHFIGRAELLIVKLRVYRIHFSTYMNAIFNSDSFHMLYIEIYHLCRTTHMMSSTFLND